MIIILEGIDKAGKSTIARNLAKLLNCRIVKRPRELLPFADGKMDIVQQYMFTAELFKKEQFVIFDRFYPSELVYSYLRGTDKLYNEANSVWQFEKWFIEKNKCLIFVIEDYEDEIQKRFVQDKEDYLRTEDVHEIIVRYEVFKTLSKADVIMLPATLNFMDKMERILSEIAHNTCTIDIEEDEL